MLNKHIGSFINGVNRSPLPTNLDRLFSPNSKSKQYKFDVLGDTIELARYYFC